MPNEKSHSIPFEKRKLKHCISPGAFWNIALVMCQKLKLSSRMPSGGLGFPSPEKVQCSSLLDWDPCLKDCHKHTEKNDAAFSKG